MSSKRKMQGPEPQSPGLRSIVCLLLTVHLIGTVSGLPSDPAWCKCRLDEKDDDSLHQLMSVNKLSPLSFMFTPIK